MRALLLALLALGLPFSGLASHENGLDRWQRTEIRVLDYSGTDGVNAKVEEATHLWDDGIAAFTMVYERHEHKACGNVEWQRGAIVVCAEPASAENQGVSQGTYRVSDNDPNKINRGRIVFRGTPVGGIAVHEMGHTLGFGHHTGEDSIMATGSGGREAQLYSYDVDVLIPKFSYDVAP